MKKNLLLPIIFTITTSTHAEIVSLVCTDPTDGYSLNFHISESANIVFYRDNMYPASFTSGEIIFNITVPNGTTYEHTINRNNGNLRIRHLSKNVFLNHFQCKKAQQKF